MANYVGINGVSRPITGGYVGVNGVARKLIKGYVGVNGVAKSIWSDEMPDPIDFIEGNYTTYENELVTSIGESTFYYYSTLQKASFPNVTSIGEFTFSGSGIQVLRVGLQSDTVCTLGTDAIPPTILAIYVPAALVDAYKTAENWSTLADKIVGV